MSDVFIFNMWEKDVGKNDAANYPVLTDILEANLELLDREENNQANFNNFG
jgi:hypothetical protein